MCLERRDWSRCPALSAGAKQRASTRVSRLVAVGTMITHRPPHSPVLALLTHTVPTLEMSPPGHSGAARTPDKLGLLMYSGTVSSISPIFGNLLGRPPSLRALRRRSPALVRALRRYYAIARLPTAVHGGLMAHRLLLPARPLLAGDCGVSRFSRMEFLCMPGVFDSAGIAPRSRFRVAQCCLPCCLTPSAPRNTRFRSSIPSLQIPLSNASSAASRPPSHGSGPGWLATPSPYDSFIRYSMPVYPGAIQTQVSAPRMRPQNRQGVFAACGGM